MYFTLILVHCRDRDISVCIATRYGMDGSGTVSLWGGGRGEIFRTRSDGSCGPPSLLYSGNRIIPGGKEARAWRWPPTPSNAAVKERVELYLIFPLWAFVACSRTNFTFTFTYRCSVKHSRLTTITTYALRCLAVFDSVKKSEPQQYLVSGFNSLPPAVHVFNVEVFLRGKLFWSRLLYIKRKRAEYDVFPRNLQTLFVIPSLSGKAIYSSRLFSKLMIEDHSCVFFVSCSLPSPYMRHFPPLLVEKCHKAILIGVKSNYINYIRYILILCFRAS